MAVLGQFKYHSLLRNTSKMKIFRSVDTLVNVDDAPLNPKLNNAPASFGGNIVRFKSPSTHHFLCTRNNNFSNRAQKSHIKVVADGNL